MTKPPLLTILIPTRNRAYYLPYAIQSALNLNNDNIEIIVSENYGSDNSWEIARSFIDPRLKVLRPDRPLPMHENFEFLLKRATGKWITFIGDDDAIMPHCADYLHYLESKYPDAEAIVTPRAYYFWESAYEISDKPKCFFSFRHREKWCDSKKKLRECLDGSIDYVHLPQIYSGGFHRRSLVQRIIRSQGGVYFRSVTPDAYSAVMAVIHTYRYLEVGVPMTWVGTSPGHVSNIALAKAGKDRYKDFFGMHSEDILTMNPCLGRLHSKWPFLLHFFEAYIAAAPFVNLSELSAKRVNTIYLSCAAQLLLRGDRQAGIELAKSLGITPFGGLLVSLSAVSIILHRGRRKVARIISSLLRSSGLLILHLLTGRGKAIGVIEYASRGEECLNILSSDAYLKLAFRKLSRLCKIVSTEAEQ